MPRSASIATIMHFYRSAVAHSDVWRQRLDSTTNWALVTTMGVLSFAFNSPNTPHFILLVLFFVIFFFLLVESRRYQIYDIWRAHVRTLQRYFIAPALADQPTLDAEEIDEHLLTLGHELGHDLPRLGVVDAIGFRIRRIYYYLFVVTLGAWFLKLYIHPDHPDSWAEYVDRAHVGPTSGSIVVLLVMLLTVLLFWVGLRAPSERIIDWTEEPSPLEQVLATRWFPQPPELEELDEARARVPWVVRSAFDELSPPEPPKGD